MPSQRKNRTILLLEYAGVLAGFLLMYLFVLPQMDVFLLARYVDDTLQGAIDFSLYYGNGRLLGNILGVYFSNHFVFSTMMIAAVLTAIVFFLNHIHFFDKCNHCLRKIGYLKEAGFQTEIQSAA